MPARPDLVGQRFGQLVVRSLDPDHPYGKSRWACTCDCGNHTLVSTSNLRKGRTKSCGCLQQAHRSGFGTKVEMIGRWFGRLVVVAEAKGRKRHGEYHWTCQCDCGKSTTVFGGSLRSGMTKSCGCLLSETRGRLNREQVRYRLPPEDRAARQLFSSYRSKAGSRGLTWDLTQEQTRSLFEGYCFYCGAAPSLTFRIPNRESDWLYNGIDRVENERGYVLDNVVSCCNTCNLAKNASSSGDFVIWVERTYANLKRKGVIE